MGCAELCHRSPRAGPRPPAAPGCMRIARMLSRAGGAAMPHFSYENLNLVAGFLGTSKRPPLWVLGTGIGRGAGPDPISVPRTQRGALAIWAEKRLACQASGRPHDILRLLEPPNSHSTWQRNPFQRLHVKIVIIDPYCEA